MPPRFFSDQPIASDSITISGDEVTHILGAHRLGAGDDIVLFDGSGDEFLAKIEETGKKSLKVAINQRRSVSRELPFELVLAVALPKGDRQKVLVEKLVELGVTRLIPVNCHRSVAIASKKSLQRLDRRVVEACKQSGRNKLMEIASPATFSELTLSASGIRVITHPSSSEANLGQLIDDAADQPITLSIGPEGGFTDDEVDLARRAGWQLMALGPTILRVETAAVCAASLFGIGRLQRRNG